LLGSPWNQLVVCTCERYRYVSVWSNSN